MSDLSLKIPLRPRRNRMRENIRSLIEETRLTPSNFIAPLFVVEGTQQRQAIASMEGVYRYSIDLLLQEVESLYQLGIPAVNLFGVVESVKKDATGSYALAKDNIVCRAVQAIKRSIPEMCVMVDIALDPFTDHGHDGLVNQKGEILNDETLHVLADMSILLAKAGADFVAPSDMMDGRVGFIRQKLDENGFSQVGILAYAAKFASAFYGPFRDILQSAPKFGDKKSYQLNPANKREAMREIKLDELEGADLLLIKPALPYLDIIAKAKEETYLPVGAYHVSGEYAMLVAASKNGWIDFDKALMESLISIKRAGADFILTYGAKKAAEILIKK